MDLNFKSFLDNLNEHELLDVIIKARDEAKNKLHIRKMK